MAFTLVAGVGDAFVLGEGGSVEVIDVGAQLQEPALGGLAAAYFQGVSDADPGDFPPAGGGDEPRLGLEEFVA
ncbi:hypothetical protein [Streptomyces mirabilis]